MNKTGNYDLTIIVPVYNEEESLPRVEKTMAEYLSHSTLHSCVLFVNDGSKDASLASIREICSRNDDMFFI